MRAQQRPCQSPGRECTPGGLGTQPGHAGVGTPHSWQTLLMFTAVLAPETMFVCSFQANAMLSTTHFCLTQWREKAYEHSTMPPMASEFCLSHELFT